MGLPAAVVPSLSRRERWKRGPYQLCTTTVPSLHGNGQGLKCLFCTREAYSTLRRPLSVSSFYPRRRRLQKPQHTPQAAGSTRGRIFNAGASRRLPGCGGLAASSPVSVELVFALRRVGGTFVLARTRQKALNHLDVSVPFRVGLSCFSFSSFFLNLEKKQLSFGPNASPYIFYPKAEMMASGEVSQTGIKDARHLIGPISVIQPGFLHTRGLVERGELKRGMGEGGGGEKVSRREEKEREKKER